MFNLDCKLLNGSLGVDLFIAVSSKFSIVAG